MRFTFFLHKSQAPDGPMMLMLRMGTQISTADVCILADLYVATNTLDHKCLKATPRGSCSLGVLALELYCWKILCTFHWVAKCIEAKCFPEDDEI
jgi:hypothetical protein